MPVDNTTPSRTSRTVQSVGIISRPRRKDIAAVVPPLLDWLEQRGVKAHCDAETAECISHSGPVKTREEIPAISDLLIVLGGDGTLLAAAEDALGGRQVPIPTGEPWAGWAS